MKPPQAYNAPLKSANARTDWLPLKRKPAPSLPQSAPSHVATPTIAVPLPSEVKLPPRTNNPL